MKNQVANSTEILIKEEIENTLIKRERQFLFWKTDWWEVVSTNHIGNDIYIISNHPIRNIILNGKNIITLPKE